MNMAASSLDFISAGESLNNLSVNKSSAVCRQIAVP